MPAAAKLMADNRLTPGDVAGTGKDGRVTKGDVLGAAAADAEATAARRRRSRQPRRKPALPAGRARRSTRPNLGDRPEQRVPMSPPARARRRAAAAVAIDQRDPDHVQRSEHGSR